MGERTPLAALDAPASGRMAVGEAITNLLAAPIELDRVKLSCNWMAACGDIRPRPATTPRSTTPCKAVGMELCPALGISVPVGKDCLSMRTRWKGEDGQQKQVTAPVCLIVSAFATLDDVRGTLDAAAPAGRHDADPGRPRPGPDAHGRLDAGAGARPVRRRGARPRRPGAAEGAGRRDQRACAPPACVLAYHDRSDGGLWAAACEMAFAGHLRREPERRPAGHRRRRHRRQPRRVRRLEELGGAGERRGARS